MEDQRGKEETTREGTRTLGEDTEAEGDTRAENGTRDKRTTNEKIKHQVRGQDTKRE